MAITVGSNLTPKQGYKIKATIMKMLEVGGKQFQRRAPKFFTKTGAPVASTAADDPGSNNCWILDITNDDLYLAYNRTGSTAFDVTKIVDQGVEK